MENYHVPLLAGQSNMWGTAPVPTVQITDPGILKMTWVDTWELAQESMSMNGGLYGPGMAFCRGVRLLMGTTYRIAAINCAVGGTKITEWLPGQPYYENMLTYAISQTKGTPCGLIWVQGESDTSLKVDAEHYAEHFIEIINGVRSDLGLPNLPVVFAKLGKPPVGICPFWTTVQTQMDLVVKSVKNIGMISTWNLPRRADQLHYLDAPTYDIVGNRLASKFCSLTR